MLQSDSVLESSPHIAGTELRFWKTVTLVAGALALYKGIRFPNRWAATQTQIDYSFGFVKRGLFGTVLGKPLRLNHYANFTVLSFVMLAALLLLITVLVSRVIGTKPVWEVAAVFAGSYCVTMLASTIGYFDILLAILAIAPLLLKRQAARLGLALALSVLGVLVHEIYLVVFLPVVMLSFALEAFAGTSSKERRVGFVAVLALAIVCAGITFRLAVHRPLSFTEVQQVKAHVASTVDFAPRDDFFDVMDRSTRDNIDIMRHFFYVLPSWREDQVQSIAVFGPALLFLGWASYQLARAQTRMSATVLFAMVLTCMVAPLALHLLAWDVGRINGLAVFAAFLALLVCLRFFGADALPVCAKRRSIALAVILLSMVSGGLQMNRVDRIFPDIHGTRTAFWQVRHWSLATIAATSD